jgi:hypothetical protein
VVANQPAKVEIIPGYVSLNLRSLVNTDIAGSFLGLEDGFRQYQHLMHNQVHATRNCGTDSPSILDQSGRYFQVQF